MNAIESKAALTMSAGNHAVAKLGLSDLREAVGYLHACARIRQRMNDSALLTVPINGRPRRVTAWLFFPGRVDVTFPGACGPLLAQSIAGNPTVLSDHCYGEYFDGDSRDMRTAAELARDERQAVLIAAASALQQRNQVVRDRRASIGWGRDAMRVDVSWQWPGVFIVADRKSGQVIGRTVPGRPDEFATDAATLGALS